MAFTTLLKLTNRQFEQPSGTTLTLNGTTNFAGVLQSKGIEIDGGVTGATSAATGQVLSFDGTKIRLQDTGAGTIGAAEDGTYDDGFFQDFDEDTPVGTPIDRFNELFALILPQPAPELDDISGALSAAANARNTSARLSFGASKNDLAFNIVDTTTGFGAVNINGTFTASGDRLGVIQGSSVTGVLNDDVVGNTNGVGIPFIDNAFGDGDIGDLVVELNGNIVETISLSGNTGATSGTFVTLTAIQPIKTNTGSDFDFLQYRTGTYSIPNAQQQDGFNYLRIIHSSDTFSRVTNYVDWVLDENNTAISITSLDVSVNTLSGSSEISGVEYYTSGSVDFTGNVANAYRNIFFNGNAINFPSRVKLNNPSNYNTTGTNIKNQTGLSGSAFPLASLFTAETNPHLADFDFTATMPIVGNVLGTSAGQGTVSSNIRVQHPFSNKTITSSVASDNSYLLYATTETNTESREDFNGESFRLEDRDYTTLTYANIDGGTYDWDSSQNLVSGNAQHSTGMLVFDGQLMTPNSSILGTTYGITDGDFSAITNAPAGQPDYSTASGERVYYRLFKSSSSSSIANINIEIAHGGNASSFLTNTFSGGTPTGSQIKVELLTKDANGSVEVDELINPFAPASASQSVDGNQVGLVGSASHAGGVTSLTCTLAALPLNDNDLVIMKVRVASTYSQSISRIEITNI